MLSKMSAAMSSIAARSFPEILLRGLFVGAVFALIHRRYARGRGGVWAMVAYLFLLLVSYQSVRSSTFYPLTPVVQQLVPSILALEAIRFVLRRIAGRPALPALGPAAG